MIAGVGVPHGDREPVLLVPGWLAGDTSLSTMTFWLRRIGYRTCRAGIRVNTDCTTAALRRVEERLERLVDRAGRPAAIVGQSRGGCFARALAISRPELVSGVVTLGSPLTNMLAVHPLVALNVRVMGALGSLGVPRVFSRTCFDGDCCSELRELYESPFPEHVRFTSIYSHSDGVVDWHSCLDPDADRFVRVDSSHCGMAVHADVYRAVGEALGEAWPAETARTVSGRPLRVAA